MRIIVDTSVIIAVISNENTKAALIEKTDGAKIYAPFSLSWEIGNAVSAMFKRKVINTEEGVKIIDEFKKIPISFVSVDLKKAVKLAAKYNIYAYDAYMIQSAREKKSPLLTLDKQLSRVASAAGIEIIEV